MLYQNDKCRKLPGNQLFFRARLLAEYDGYGACLREYVYIGAKMVAEYHPLDNKYYYYTTDQINSTRVVTNDEGSVVYAAAHDPYGGIQQTWTNAFNPELKYSGKENDAESGLYYFGARYYDPTLYRFLSPDPVINMPLITSDMQMWNLYCYCRDNPIGYIDANGFYVSWYTLHLFRVPYGTKIYYPQRDKPIIMNEPGLTLVTGATILVTKRPEGKEELAFIPHFDVYILDNEQLEFLGADFKSVWNHELICHVQFVRSYVDKYLDWIEREWRKESKINAEDALENAYKRLESVTKTAEWLSNVLFDYEVSGIIETIYHIWADIDQYWINFSSDPFMTWILRVPYAY